MLEFEVYSSNIANSDLSHVEGHLVIANIITLYSFLMYVKRNKNLLILILLLLF